MTKKDGLTISYRELFFYLYFALMFGMRMWGVYEGTKLYGPLLILGFAFWVISVLMTEHTLLEYIIMLLFLTLAGVVYLNSGEKGLLLYFTLMLGMKNIDVKKLFKVGIFVGGAGMACMGFLTSFGFKEDVIYLQSRPIVGTVFRHALGMPHPNTLSTSFIILSVMIMYIVGYENIRKIWKISALLAVIAFYLYLYSGSRTGIVVNYGFLAVNILYAYRKRIGVIEKTILCMLFPMLWMISIALPMVATRELAARLQEIDYTLMARIKHGMNYLRYNPITAWGTRIVNPETQSGLDLSQLYLLLNLGVVAFIVVTILNILLVIYEVRENKIQELIITTLFLIMGLTDPFLYNISFKNLYFIFMGVMLYRYMSNLEQRLPEWLSIKINVIKLGGFGVTLGFIDAFWEKQNNSGNIFRKRLLLLFCSAVLLASMVATIVYLATPTPQYVMTDRNKGEHLLIEGLRGRPYTRQEIIDIKRQGNVVLNYTDENELMYVYYSDENKPVDGGHYTKNAAIMEKVRRSITILFWGTILLTGLFYATVLAKYYFNEKHNRQE